MSMKATSVQNLAITYLALWATSPFLAYGTIERLLAVLAIAVWTIIEISRPQNIINRPTLPVLLTLVFVAYTGLVELMFEGVFGLISHLQTWIMLLFLIVHQSRRNNLHSLVPVFWSVLATLPIWQFITSYAIASGNSRAARIGVRSSVEAMKLAEQGVGGYALVYGTLLLMPGLILMGLNGQWRKNTRLPWPLRATPRIAQVLVLVNILLGAWLLLTAGYSIAVIGLTLIVLSVFVMKRYSSPRVFFVFAAIMAAALFGKILLEYVLSSLLPLTDGTNFANKIRDVLFSIQLNESVGTAEDRAVRYLRSFELFLQHPVVGVLSFEEIGKHSQILDTFARWGVIFGSIFVYLILFLPIRAMKTMRNNFGAPLGMFIATIVLFGLNNGFGGAGVMIFIMFPVAAHLLTGTELRLPKRTEAFRRV